MLHKMNEGLLTELSAPWTEARSLDSQPQGSNWPLRDAPTPFKDFASLVQHQLRCQSSVCHMLSVGLQALERTFRKIK